MRGASEGLREIYLVRSERKQGVYGKNVSFLF